MTSLGIISPLEHYRTAGLGVLCSGLSELRVGVDAEPGQDVGQRHGGVAVAAAEAVVSLTIDVNTRAVHLGAAPGLALVGAPVHPLCTGDVGHAVEREGKHAGTSSVRPGHRQTTAGCSCSGGCSRGAAGG